MGLKHKPSTSNIFCIIITAFFHLSNLFTSEAKIRLDRSDHQAVLTIQRSFGIRLVNESQARHPCTSAGVYCQRMVVGGFSDVLRVTHLRFESMELEGFLHPAIGKLSELKELRLSNNHLVDRIPDEIVDCRKLEVVELKNNMLSGSLTPELSLLTSLRVLDLSSNKLSGNLNFLKQFVNLEHLSLADNGFSGKVPDSVRSFRNLQTFDLSGNPFLTGVVDIESLMKTSVDGDGLRRSLLVAEGPVSKSENGGNLVSAPAEAPGPMAAGGVNTNKKKAVRTVFTILGFFVGLIAGGISGMVLSVVFKLLLTLIRGKKKSEITIFSTNVIKNRQELLFLEKEEGVASLQCIGKGGCGEVYKTELPGSNGLVLAIKKIIQPPADATELTEEDTKMLGKKLRQISEKRSPLRRLRAQSREEKMEK